MRQFVFCMGMALVITGQAIAEDNCLTREEKADGWQLLFNGKDYTDWVCSNGKPVSSAVEDGAIMPYKSGGYLVVHEKQFGDFVLKCDVRMPEDCNSGVFFRVGDLKDPVQTGFEIQISSHAGESYHNFGAVYDLAKSKKAKLNPTGEWNSVVITCRGPEVSVEVNGEQVSKLNCDDFTEVGKRPDGSSHKFNKRGIAVKDFARKGYLGFQDHGHKVWFKNVKLRELN